MVRYLSPEWIDELNAVAASGVDIGDLRLVIQQVVTDGPEGDVCYAVRIHDGAVRIVPGAADDADVTVTEDHATAVAVARGDLAAPAAFMTGRIRVTGDTGLLLDAQPVLHRLDALFAGVRDRTTF